MLPTSQTTVETDIVIDRETHTITLRRRLSASPERAFEAWTRPEQVSVWWDPSGQPLADCEIDLRPGGAFTFVSRVPGGPHQFGGVYREIRRPDYLAFEAMGAIGRVRLEGAGGVTRMTVTIECRSAEHLDQYLEMGVHIGTERTLDNLVAYLAAARSA